MTLITRDRSISEIKEIKIVGSKNDLFELVFSDESTKNIMTKLVLKISEV